MVPLSPNARLRLKHAGLPVLPAPDARAMFVLLKHFPSVRVICIPVRPGAERPAWDLAARIRFRCPRIGIVLLGEGALAPDLRFSPVPNVCTCPAGDPNLPDLLNALLARD
ncbi:hypothetical protein [Falsirhodobacter sp. 20TX0035]|uniref:hypothetical protein n=1 Tax=Falsirhodobacter sp. 20TX0035 TaxID=3022019 RepID=UPI0023310F32|nr:hypothetical protein [Falsirhodobacter sp. 20TX0035]MDB6453753.1 hypothetical protein [Falsirhodobacter sp. 20TX0035]